MKKTTTPLYIALFAIVFGFFFSVLSYSSSAQTVTVNVEIQVLKLCEAVNVPNSKCTQRGIPVRDLITDEVIPCDAGNTDYGCGSGGYPFSENPVTLDMDDYVKSVLPGETSPGYDPYEFLKAQAIAARMYAHHQTSDGTVVINNSIEKQLYIPNSEYPRSNQAIADTEGVVVAYQGNIINAMFSADHGEFSPGPDYTRDGGTPYLKGVYDPAVGASPNGHGWGMAQTGAKNWAKGQDNHGNSVPPWDYCRILSHYYTGVHS